LAAGRAARVPLRVDAAGARAVPQGSESGFPRRAEPGVLLDRARRCHARRSAGRSVLGGARDRADPVRPRGRAPDGRPAFSRDRRGGAEADTLVCVSACRSVDTDAAGLNALAERLVDGRIANENTQERWTAASAA